MPITNGAFYNKRTWGLTFAPKAGSKWNVWIIAQGPAEVCLPSSKRSVFNGYFLVWDPLLTVTECPAPYGAHQAKAKGTGAVLGPRPSSAPGYLARTEADWCLCRNASSLPQAAWPGADCRAGASGIVRSCGGSGLSAEA